jgi:hypothetical protein
MTDTPVNYTEQFQNKIREQMEGLLTVNEPARDHKLRIEKSLENEPYIAHLYSEQQYEQLIFFESRRTNFLLEKIVRLLENQYPEAAIEVAKEMASSIPSLSDTPMDMPPERFEEEIPGEVQEYESDEMPGEELPFTEVTPETESLGESERGSVKISQSKKPGARRK